MDKKIVEKYDKYDCINSNNKNDRKKMKLKLKNISYTHTRTNTKTNINADDKKINTNKIFPQQKTTNRQNPKMLINSTPNLNLNLNLKLN